MRNSPLESLSYWHGYPKDINYLMIPVTNFPIDRQGAHEFNIVYDYLKSLDLDELPRTNSGGISTKFMGKLINSWSVKKSNYGVEIVAIVDCHAYRLQFRTPPGTGEDNKPLLSGHQAFLRFRQICLKYGIKLEDYRVSPEEGKRIKETIPKPHIEFYSNIFRDKELNNVCHLDFRSSFMTGLANRYPEFLPIVQHCYDLRKDPENNLTFKAILNYSFGYMQSEYVHYAYAHLSKAMIEDNNQRIEDMTMKLIDSGRGPLLYNTDGIWYKGDPFHDENEGNVIGKWHNDHVNCRFRAKSAGSYEYLENGIYHAVVRGHTRLDDVKPRSEWQWGDIYNDNAQPIKFDWLDGQGVFIDGAKA